MDIEQTETTETTATEASDQASRDELIAAVREAGGTEAVDVAAEEAAAKPKAPEAAPAAPAEPSEDDKLAAVLKAREERHKKRLDADEYAAQAKSRADTEAQRIIDEAKAEARKAAERELADLKARFAGSPTATLRALGDPEEIADAVMREGTPEARALRIAQEEARLAREEAKDGKSAKEELAQFKQELTQEKQAAAYARARDEFLGTHAQRTATPAIYAQHRTPDAVFRALDAQCREWEADGLKRGIDFDDATLVKYVERNSRSWLQEMGFTLSETTPAQQVSADAPAKGPGNAPKVTANGPRTLSAAAGSERRTSPRPLHELPPDQQRQALIEEVAAARRANPDASS